MAEKPSPAELIAAYRRGAGILRVALAGMDQDALFARPIAGLLSSQEVACHRQAAAHGRGVHLLRLHPALPRQGP